MLLQDIILTNEKLEEYILDESCEILVTSNNKKEFISSFITYFTKAYGHSKYDYVEVFDVENPEYIKVELKDTKVVVTASLFVGLSIWLQKKALGKITATFEGTYSFVLIDPDNKTISSNETLHLYNTSISINEFKVEKLQCVEQYFDDYTVL
jgi:hypothetical protein